MGDTVYRIRRADGLYSTGGSNPRWTAKGKTWSGTGPLKNHLHFIRNSWATRAYGNPYKDAELVAFVVSEEESARLDLHTLQDDLAAQVEEQRKQYELQAAKRRAEYERKEYERLAAKYART